MFIGSDRTARLDRLLAERDLAAVWFARPENFAWLTGGSNVVDRAAETGVAAACYNGSVHVLTSDIEADRISTEELAGDIPVHSFPWHAQSLSEAIAERTARPAAADFSVSGLGDLSATSLRQPLTEPDIDRYRTLSKETAAAVETACRTAAPEETERSVAARLRGRLAEDGIETPVVLVGGGERAPRYRHYTPTEAELGDYALVSVTARRHGLHASCTRTVAFDPPSWLVEHHAVATRVETTAVAATRRRDTAGGVFAAIQDAYATLGHEDEWRAHHQGGAAGFAGREWIATPDSDDPVYRPMAYAWNPTVQGAKSEDTVLVSDSDVEVLTRTDEWPQRKTHAVGGDLTMRRPDILMQ